jgi:hypothetical protein
VEGEGGGGGAGAGGFCATVTGTRSDIAGASTTKMRMRWLIDRCLEKKRLKPQILGRKSVQVKAPDSITAKPGCCGASGMGAYEEPPSLLVPE